MVTGEVRKHIKKIYDVKHRQAVRYTSEHYISIARRSDSIGTRDALWNHYVPQWEAPFLPMPSCYCNLDEPASQTLCYTLSQSSKLWLSYMILSKSDQMSDL